VPRVLVIDNYDSFTWNLVQYLEMLGARCDVRLNDRVAASEVDAIAPDAILISPGPCTPNEAGASLAILGEQSGKRPILGVCLGHQAIAQVFGGNVVRADRVVHGKTSPIEHDGETIYRGLEQGFVATRYHSLLVERASLPAALVITAWTAEGEIMGLRHREHATIGVQFHPESILTVRGMELLRNWVGSIPLRDAN
jgi:para-aminobenzoate synthetase component 2